MAFEFTPFFEPPGWGATTIRGDATWPRHTTAHACSETLFPNELALGGRKPRSCSPIQSAACPADSPSALERLTLSFSVDRTEEYVRVQAVTGRGILDLGARAQNFLLLTLARQRVADTDDGLPETSCGWIDAEDLSRDLGVAQHTLNVDVFRIRRHFASRGVVGAVNVIERRQSTRQIRIGASRFSIVGI